MTTARAVLVALPVVALAGVASAAPAARPATVAVASRCNARIINDYYGQIRAFDAHPPKDNPDALNARLADIGDVLGSLNEEHDILDNICTSDSEKAPLFSQLNATTAWGLLLQADIAGKLNASCPPAAKALPAAMVAQAWLALAATVNDLGGTVPQPVAEVAPKVQSRAAALGLALPAYPDTSAYWRDQIAEQAKQAVAICPTPVPPPPTPTPSPYPSP